MSNQVKQIRVTLDTPEDQKTVADFIMLSVIRGKAYERELLKAIEDHIGKHGKPLRRGEWLSQSDVIDRLQSEYGIATNSQTLMNYRAGKLLEGAYCSDGQKRVFYLLEATAAIFQKPRVRRKLQKKKAV